MSVPTLAEIIELSRSGVIDEEGQRALIAEHHPFLIGHFKVPVLEPTAGERTEEPDVPSLDSLVALEAKGVITSDGLRAALTKYHPEMQEHIVVTKRAFDAAALHAHLVETYGEDGVRDMTITISHDGEVTSGPTTDGGTVTDDGAEDQITLIQGIDACLDHAAAAVGDTDLTTLPDNIQQALSLMQAAGVAVDELQNVMGIDDPDDPLDTEGGRAALTTADENDLPDSSFAYIEPGGVKDGSGKTTPRKKRHFPLEKTPGTLDPDHVRNAISRIGQDAEFSKQASPAVKAAAKKLDIDAPSLGDDGGKRSTDELADQLRERFGSGA